MSSELKTGFLLYANYYDILKDLSDEDAGILFKAILKYQATREEIKLPMNLDLAFRFIKNQFDIDDEKYTKHQEKQRQNGLKGGRPKKEENPKNPPVFSETQKSLNDNDNVNVNVNDNEKENVFISNKKIDKFNSQIFSEFLQAYKNAFNQTGFLSNTQRDKVIELYETIPDLKERLPKVMQRLKDLKFQNIDFKPNLAWLLKNDNFYAVLAGEYEKDDDFADFLNEYRKEKEDALIT